MAPKTETIPRNGHGTGKAEVTHGAGPGGSLGGGSGPQSEAVPEVGKARNPRAGGARLVAQPPSRAKLSGVPVPKDGAVAAGALWLGRVVLRFLGIGKVGTFAGGSRRPRSLRVPLLPPAPI